MKTGFRELIREKAVIRLLFLDHATQQMMRPDRMIEPVEVEKTVQHGEIIGYIRISETSKCSNVAVS